MILVFMSSFLRGYVRRNGIGIVLRTEQSIKSFVFIFQGVCLNFKSTFLRILTGKKHPKTKLQLLRKIQIWTSESLVHQIKSF